MKKAYKALLVASLAMVGGGTALAQVGSVPPVTPAAQGVTNTRTDNEPRPTPAAPAATAAAPAPAAAAAQTTLQEPERVVRKEVDQDEYLGIQGVGRIAVSNTNVITATVSPDGNGILVHSKAAGTSDLRAMLNDGSVRLIRFVVSSQDVAKDLQTLRQLLSDVVGVSASQVGDLLVVQGTIVSMADYQRYQTIIKNFNVVDLVESQITQSEQQKMLAQLRQDFDARNFGQIKAELKENNEKEISAWLTGVATTDREKSEAEQIAKLYFPNVISHIQLQKPIIELDVVLVTVDMSKADRRGTNIYNQLNSIDFQLLREVEQADPQTGIISNFYTAQAVQRLNGHGDDAAREYLFNYPGAAGGRAGTGLDFGTDNAGYGEDELLVTWDPGGNVLAQIEATKTQDYVVHYQAPHLSVVSGETASFKDGLSTFVSLEGANTTSVANIEQGVQVSATPFILENGKIRIQITTSTKATTNNQTSSDDEIFSLKDVNTSSVVEVSDGQTIIVAGSNANLFSTTKNEMPLLGKIPIINLFFKFQARQGTQVRSFIFVTPTSPNIWTEANRKRHSDNADRARQYYERDSQYRKGSVGYYLGWEKDIPAPPALTPAPEDKFGTGAK
ncbi:pilus assembly protein N-terminal domain-containing protein [Candidatus Sumerlaeota bacterium]|nr:pilus assembly protein N-terminal domain-containing protein [Candidatus Sumerlaeota bacterium]